MQRTDLLALLPLLILAGTVVVVMLTIAWQRRHGLVAALSAAGLAATVLSLPQARELAPRQITPLLVIDGFAIFFIGLVCSASLVVVMLAYGYTRAGQGRESEQREPEQREELYLLLLLGTLGAVVLAASNHFVSLFLGVEILSVSLYGLIAYPTARLKALEAGLKYLILAAASSAFLLFGMALVYAQLGSMDFATLAERLNSDTLSSMLSIAGIGLMIAGIGFKLAVVPFHLWTPDVYAGAPVPVTAFIASVSKGGVLALLLRFLLEVEAAGRTMIVALSLIAIASMVVGNLLALLQTNVKRLLAYSSIAHLGYALVALLATGDLAVEAASYYVAAYMTTILAAFGVVTALSTPVAEAEDLEHYRGLFWRRPWIAALFTVSLLSLAGIPLTAGFLGKFYVVLAGVQSAMWPLVFSLVLGSVLGLFYYLRVVVALFSGSSSESFSKSSGSSEGEVRELRLGWVMSAALSSLAVPLLWLGIYPEPFVRLIRSLLAGVA